MGFSYVKQLPAECEADPALLLLSNRLFTFTSGDAILAFGGEILPEMAGAEVYLWLEVLPREYSRAAIRAALRFIRAYLGLLPWRPMAECAIANSRNEKFLLACGFTHKENLGDRNLYQWGM